ncbi:MAG: glycosyltransferase family 2 protein [Bacteroidota bacterium]
MKLAIIIPVHNGLNYTRECLKELHNQTRKVIGSSVEIIVVDDGSTDGTSNWIASNYPRVHILKGNGSLWWSGSVNTGVEYAIDKLSSDYILWWNNDVIPASAYLPSLFEIIEKSNPNEIIGSKVYRSEKRDIIWAMGGVFNPRTGWKDMIGFNTQDGPEYNIPLEVDWLPGMGSCFPARVFNETGLLNAKVFPQYHGDIDFTWRAKLKGYKIVVYPRLQLYNHTENTSKKHEGSIKSLRDSLTTIKSNYNIKKDILFYRKYARSPLAYKILFLKYGRYIGGFLKWKLLNFFGIRKTTLFA